MGEWHEPELSESNNVAFVSYKGLLNLSRHVRKDGLRMIRRRKGVWYIQIDAYQLTRSVCEVYASRHINGDEIIHYDKRKNINLLIKRPEIRMEREPIPSDPILHYGFSYWNKL